MKNTIILVGLMFLSACDLKTLFNEDDSTPEMYKLNKIAREQESNKDYINAIDNFRKCISERPGIVHLRTSRARRWCQNNLSNLIAQCDNPYLCDPKEAKVLAENLVLYNPGGQKDIAYVSTLARAYFVNGDYENAVKYQQIAILNMSDNYKHRNYYNKRLEFYKNKLDESTSFLTSP